MAVRIGTSGWSYDHWQNIVYPEGTSGTKRLDFYLQRFDTVELNSSYYHWPRDETFASWQRRLPEGFAMVVKAPRGLTHSKKLYEPEVWLERIERGIRKLGDRFAALLVQLPPSLSCDLPRLHYFLEKSPRWLQLAIEFRHDSWHNEAIFQMLETYNAAYCITSGAGLPCILRATSRLVYLRFHGPDQRHLYAGSYSENDLRWWADRIHEWQAQGRDVVAYFNNDGHGYAVYNAETLRWLVNG